MQISPSRSLTITDPKNPSKSRGFIRDRSYGDSVSEIGNGNIVIAWIERHKRGRLDWLKEELKFEIFNSNLDTNVDRKTASLLDRVLHPWGYIQRPNVMA